MPGIESFNTPQPQLQPVHLQSQPLPFADPPQSVRQPLDIRYGRPLEVLPGRQPLNIRTGKPLNLQPAPTPVSGFAPVSGGAAAITLLPLMDAATAEFWDRVLPDELEEPIQPFVVPDGLALPTDFLGAGPIEQPGVPIFSPTDYRNVGGVRIRVQPNGVPIVIANNGSYDQNVLSYKVVPHPTAEGFMQLQTTNCQGQFIPNNYTIQPGTGVTILSQGVCGSPQPQTEVTGQTEPTRKPNPARVGAPASRPLPQPEPTPFASGSPSGLPFPEFADPVGDLTPDELGDMLVPRVDPLTGEVDPSRQPVPLWELPDDEWLVSPPYWPQTVEEGNTPEKQPDRRFPPIISVNNPTVTPIVPIAPTIEVPSYPTPINPCCDVGSDCDLEPISDLLNTEIEGEMVLVACDSNTEEVLAVQGNGLEGLSLKLDMLADAMVMIWDKVKCPNDTELALPESWAVKTGQTTGQWVITWKPISGGSSRWSSTIPHPRFTDLGIAMGSWQDITYSRGDVMVNVQNRDNTHCIMNVKDESEANRAVEWISYLTDETYANSQLPKITKGLKARIEVREVRPCVVKYYSQGQGNLIPDWIFKVGNDGIPTVG